MSPRITGTKRTLLGIQEKIVLARHSGNHRALIKAQTILMVLQGTRYEVISKISGITVETIRLWVNKFLSQGVRMFFSKTRKSKGRIPKLSKSEKAALKRAVLRGPEALGYLGACWRSPMIQDYILKTFNVFYSVHYISQLLKNLGLSYQKAKFVSDHISEEKREKWLKETWPLIVKLSKEKNAHIMFGDEASFPQWGTLSYTWAERGKTPIIKTSGKRKGYKVFGLIEYWTSKFYYKAFDGRLNSGSYIDFLRQVLSETRKHIILIQDGAKYHISKEVKNFFEKNKSRLTVFQLPSYSPDYNPIEKLWKKIKEQGTHLVYFKEFDDLKSKVDEVLLNFKGNQKEVCPLSNFYDELLIGAR